MTDRRTNTLRTYGHHPSCRAADCDSCGLIVEVDDKGRCTCVRPKDCCPMDNPCGGPCTLSQIFTAGHSIRWPSGAIATAAIPRILELEQQHDELRKLLLERGVDPCAAHCAHEVEPEPTECCCVECCWYREKAGVVPPHKGME